MKYYIYILESKRRKYIYVGMSSNIEQRLKFHNSGYNRTTKPYRPFKLVLVESYSSRTKARRREKYLKSGMGKEWIKSQMPKWRNW